MTEDDYIDLIEPDFIGCHNICRPFTMTSPGKLYALYNAVRYVKRSGLPGAFVECGVWKGGSVMMMAMALRVMGIEDQDIYLFDTFDGMTPPTDVDENLKGEKVSDLLARASKTEQIWAYSPIDEVRANLQITGYPMERFKFVQGDVLKTIPAEAPEAISLLRLDTDWYESTKQELDHLFPRLAKNGILILDDYGCFKGARKAVDEYFRGHNTPYYMNRICGSGRTILKSG